MRTSITSFISQILGTIPQDDLLTKDYKKAFKLLLEKHALRLDQDGKLELDPAPLRFSNQKAKSSLLQLPGIQSSQKHLGLDDYFKMKAQDLRENPARKLAPEKVSKSSGYAAPSGSSLTKALGFGLAFLTRGVGATDNVANNSQGLVSSSNSSLSANSSAVTPLNFPAVDANNFVATKSTTFNESSAKAALDPVVTTHLDAFVKAETALLRQAPTEISESIIKPKNAFTESDNDLFREQLQIEKINEGLLKDDPNIMYDVIYDIRVALKNNDVSSLQSISGLREILNYRKDSAHGTILQTILALTPNIKQSTISELIQIAGQMPSVYVNPPRATWDYYEKLVKAGNDISGLYEGFTPLEHAIRNRDYLLQSNLAALGAKVSMEYMVSNLVSEINDRGDFGGIDYTYYKDIKDGDGLTVLDNVISQLPEDKITTSIIVKMMRKGFSPSSPLHKRYEALFSDYKINEIFAWGPHRETILDLVKQSGNLELEEILRKKGAKLYSELVDKVILAVKENDLEAIDEILKIPSIHTNLLSSSAHSFGNLQGEGLLNSIVITSSPVANSAIKKLTKPFAKFDFYHFSSDYHWQEYAYSIKAYIDRDLLDSEVLSPLLEAAIKNKQTIAERNLRAAGAKTSSEILYETVWKVMDDIANGTLDFATATGILGTLFISQDNYYRNPLRDAVEARDAESVNSILASHSAEENFAMLLDGKCIEKATTHGDCDILLMLLSAIHNPRIAKAIICKSDEVGSHALLRLALDQNRTDIMDVFLQEFDSEERLAVIRAIPGNENFNKLKTLVQERKIYMLATILRSIDDQAFIKFFIQEINRENIAEENGGKRNLFKALMMEGKTREALVFLDLIQDPQEKLIMIKDPSSQNDFAIFRIMAQKGRLDDLKTLLQLVEDPKEKLAMIKARNVEGEFAAFRIAAEAGRDDIIEFLLESVTDPNEKANMVRVGKARGGNAARINAARSEIRNLNHSLDPEDAVIAERKMFELEPELRFAQSLLLDPQDFFAFRVSVEKGYVDIVNLLLDAVDEVTKHEMISANNYHAFRTAVISKQFDIAKLLLSSADLAERNDMINAGRLVALGIDSHDQRNSSEFFLELLEDPAQKLEQIRARDEDGKYAIFKFALRSGQLTLVRTCLQLESEKQSQMIKSADKIDPFLTAETAAKSGQLDILQFCFSDLCKDESQRLEIISRDDFSIFKILVTSGQMKAANSIFQQVLESKDSATLNALIGCDNYAIFKTLADRAAHDDKISYNFIETILSSISLEDRIKLVDQSQVIAFINREPELESKENYDEEKTAIINFLSRESLQNIDDKARAQVKIMDELHLFEDRNIAAQIAAFENPSINNELFGLVRQNPQAKIAARAEQERQENLPAKVIESGNASPVKTSDPLTINRN